MDIASVMHSGLGHSQMSDLNDEHLKQALEDMLMTD
jgi:hypothetical protein